MRGRAAEHGRSDQGVPSRYERRRHPRCARTHDGGGTSDHSDGASHHGDGSSDHGDGAAHDGAPVAGRRPRRHARRPASRNPAASLPALTAARPCAAAQEGRQGHHRRAARDHRARMRSVRHHVLAALPGADRCRRAGAHRAGGGRAPRNRGGCAEGGAAQAPRRDPAHLRRGPRRIRLAHPGPGEGHRLRGQLLRPVVLRVL